jgi:hypothetical protein
MDNRIKLKFWQHNCQEVGLTATLRGEPCNYCDVTEETIENWVITEDLDRDILVDPEI